MKYKDLNSKQKAIWGQLPFFLHSSRGGCRAEAPRGPLARVQPNRSRKGSSTLCEKLISVMSALPAHSTYNWRQ